MFSNFTPTSQLRWASKIDGGLQMYGGRISNVAFFRGLGLYMKIIVEKSEPYNVGEQHVGVSQHQTPLINGPLNGTLNARKWFVMDWIPEAAVERVVGEDILARVGMEYSE